MGRFFLERLCRFIDHTSVVAEKCHRDGSGTDVGADGAADGTHGQVICLFLIQGGTVGDVLLQHGIVQSAVCQGERQVEVDAAILLHQCHQHIIAILGATGLVQDRHRAVFHGDDGLDAEHRADQRRRGAHAAAAL